MTSEGDLFHSQLTDVEFNPNTAFSPYNIGDILLPQNNMMTP